MPDSPSSLTFPRRALGILLAATLLATFLASASPASAQINVPPIVIAGQDQVIPIGQTDVVNLNASGTLDIDDNASRPPLQSGRCHAFQL